MPVRDPRLWLSLSCSVLFAACSGGSSSSTAPSEGFELVELSNGFGRLLPHQARRLDAAGQPTAELVALRTHADLERHVTANNPVLPPSRFPTGATLPNGAAGNHFFALEFSAPVDAEQLLDAAPTASVGLSGALTVLAYDPSTGESVPVAGRAFVGGRTRGAAQGQPPSRPLEAWVTLVGGRPQANAQFDHDGDGVADGLGFPGSEGASAFAGAAQLVDPRVVVFVADSDGDLATHEAFPSGRELRVRATTALRSASGATLARQAVAGTTVGPDLLPPEVATTPPPNALPLTSPAFGDVDVDPLTSVRIEFSESIQPASLGSFAGAGAPAPSAAVTLTFGPPTQPTQVPFSVRPVSVYDLTTWELRPAFAFPGAGPATLTCAAFNRVRVELAAQQFEDLAANFNQRAASTEFTTGEGPGLVNAPVAPDALYVARGGATPALSVVDLNGFGQSTGDPSFDFSYQSFPKGWSRFPLNPNLVQYGAALYPPLFPGVCTVDGGSSGVFTLVRDSSLDDRLVRAPLVTAVGEMALGASLELVYHNGKDSTGCRFGGGNFCAVNGKKTVQLVQRGPSSLGPPLPGQAPLVSAPGAPNPISFAPHPNPPGLRFPPLCVQPWIGGEEPSSVVNTVANLLAPGVPLGSFDTPPSGLLAREQNAWFVGPDRSSQTSSGACAEFMVRQQIGHFLYVLDRARSEVVVLNSNRMSVLERIACADPTDLTLAPNLDYLAVSGQSADVVTFIDVDPSSSSFHQVVKVTPVGRGPRGLAWDPGNEDILVCNEGDSSLSVISAFTFNVRKTLTSHLAQPFDVVITQRQSTFGWGRNVYFGWVLNRNGDLSLFESGPNGVNGWGYDAVIGVAPMRFDNPKRIAPNLGYLGGSVWIVHENPLTPQGVPSGELGGAVTRIDITSASFGPLPLSGLQAALNPQFRDMGLSVVASIGPSQLTGVPVDIAFDEQSNLGGLPNVASPYGVGSPLQVNGRSQVRTTTTTVPVCASRLMFLAVPNSSEGPGVIDVVQLGGHQRVDTDLYLPGVQSIPCAGARALASYFRY